MMADEGKGVLVRMPEHMLSVGTQILVYGETLAHCVQTSILDRCFAIIGQLSSFRCPIPAGEALQ